MAGSSRGPREAGLLESLSTLSHSVLELLHVRIELFSVEWQEERERAKHLFVLAIGGALLLLLGMLLLTFFIVVLFWDSYRLTAIAVVTVVYLGGGWLCLWEIRHELKKRLPPFSASLHEFAEDLRQLKGHGAKKSESANVDTVLAAQKSGDAR